ncbi:unnamed protein product [Withania somnifera]
MKSLSNDDNTNNHRLGFSLSPHINSLEGPLSEHHQSTQPGSSDVQSSVAIRCSSAHLNYPSMYYEGDNAGLFSFLSAMPLKSDGSLCIMKGFNRSPQPQGMISSTPKLEDFFGDAAMGSHHYEGCNRGGMAHSLHNIYYNQHQENETNNSQDFLNHIQETSRQQQQHYYPDFTAFRGHELYHSTEQGKTECSNLQVPTMTSNEISDMNNWVSSNYQNPTGHTLEQNMIGCMADNGAESGSVGVLTYGDFKSLSLSMSPGSQSSCVTGTQQISPTLTECISMETKKRGPEKVNHQKQTIHRKSIDTFGQRTSQYRGVTRHRWTGRYEAHLWDNSCKKEGQSRKGRQVYLGGYDMEDKAARAYDLAALKYWGPSTHINFPLENYQQELEEMKNLTRQEYVAHLRRKSSGFSRGASMYRGVTREKKETETSNEICNQNLIANASHHGEVNIQNKEENGNSVDWTMSLYQSPSAGVDTNTMSSTTLHDQVEESARTNTHLSNASSLITSLGSSREVSPAKDNGHLMHNVAMPQSAPKLISGPATNITSWISSAQLRPNVPVFAAWTDA